jgi:octaprenyl-diphosphate synthase
MLSAFDDYGRKLGLAFQIVDDVLDFAGDPTVFGKALGHDVAEGTVTLPLAYAMADDTKLAADVGVLVDDFSAGRESSVDSTAIVDRVCSSGALDRARDQAKRLTGASLLSLEPVADSQYKSALQLLAASLLERVS